MFYVQVPYINDKTALQRSLDLEVKRVKIEESKVKFYEQRAENRKIDTDDMLFLKSLYPFMKKAEDKLALRLNILTTIRRDFLQSEQIGRSSYL